MYSLDIENLQFQITKCLTLISYSAKYMLNLLKFDVIYYILYIYIYICL